MIWVLGLVLVGALSFVAASSHSTFGNSGSYGGSSNDGFDANFQYYQPNFNQIYGSQVGNYWPIFEQMKNNQCNATSDFVVMIPPGGCSPSVVRSDLLEEQNVPVFCQLQSIQVNPLIKVSSIKSISFKGDYPEGVSGISFHPARAATRSYRTLLGSPIINNIGYVVIILKRNQIEENMEDWISGNLTATIRYDAEEAYGVGRSSYYLPVMGDDEWEAEYTRTAFWKGRGYLRLREVNKDSGIIEVYNDKDSLSRTLQLKEGETSGLEYFPGYYCRAGMRVKLNKVVAPEDMVLLNIDGEETWARSGSRILNNQCTVRVVDIDEEDAGSIKISCPGKSVVMSLSKKEDTGGPSLVDADIGDAETPFKKGTGVVDELVDTYPTVSKGELSESYSEEALIEQIELARDAGKVETQQRLLDLFLTTYPSSKSFDVMKRQAGKFTEYDFSKAYGNIFVGNKYHSISINEFKGLKNESKKVSFKIGSQLFDGKEEGFTEDIGDGNIIIKKILPGEAKVSFTSKSGGDYRSDSDTIGEGEYGSLGGRSIYIQKIDMEVFAHVSLIPEVQRTKTEADFTFNVGIEKRGIELSPEKTREMLENVNDSIEQWSDINDRLGATVKAWKGACLATSTILMLKNVASGFSGVGLARQKIMVKYKADCASLVADGTYDTQSKCYTALASEIDKDVEAMADSLDAVNDIMEGPVENNKVSGGILGEDRVVNQTALVDDLRVKLGDFSLTVEGEVLTEDDLTTSSQIRAALLAKELEGKGGVAEEIAKADLNKTLRNVALVNKAEDSRKKVLAEIESTFGGGGKTPDVKSFVSKDVQVIQWGGQYAKDFPNLVSGVEEDSKIQFFDYNSKEYLLVLDNSALNGNLGIKESYRLESSGWVKEATSGELDKIIFSEAGSSGSCSNTWPGTPEVHYYESGVSKGLPAIVPFDVKEGWYAMVPNSAGTFLENSPKGFDSSGAVNYFHICNIGEDGVMNWGASGGDVCQSFDPNSVGSIENFAPCQGKSKAEVLKLYGRATEAIRQASRQYGDKNINIFNQAMKLGKPASDLGGVECQDFMSPSDCKILFNACDPVVCSNSRCDFGGKYPVSDVIQTGIVGGLMMCSQNFPEVKVPICLSGVHAGIDTFVSILETEQSCLQESLDSGKLVGICDEITAINECKFFWEQLSPVMRLAGPRLVEKITDSSRTKGGGEYLLVQSAFDNLEKSVGYFKNTYAPNMFRAFQLRNIEEVGSEFCNAFIGTSVPSTADALDSFLEPESPSQFFAYFSEETFTDVTVPATSQYNIYYHIYAGNDKGRQFRVYLKNPPASGYYANSPIINIRTGYIPRGTSADESIDITAPEGYKELCVVIDNQEECGFRQVSTDFGIKRIQDKYVEDQVLRTDIDSENECISGSPSLVPSFSLNLGAIANDAVDPNIAKRGIVRVCASNNPDIGSQRWKNVGNCGDESLGCWMDTESVKDSLKLVGEVNNATLSEVLDNRYRIDDEIKTQNQVQAILSIAEKAIKAMEISGFENEGVGEVLVSLDEIIGKDVEVGLGTDRDKARAFSLKASVYRGLVREVIELLAPRSEGSGDDLEDVESDVEEEVYWKVVDKTLNGDEVTLTIVNPEGLRMFLKGSFEGEVIGEVIPISGRASFGEVDIGDLFIGNGVSDEDDDAKEIFIGNLNEGDILEKGEQRYKILLVAGNEDSIIISLERIGDLDLPGSPSPIRGSPSDSLEVHGFRLIGE